MITTLSPLCTELSDKLNESTADVSNKRQRMLVKGIRKVLSMYKFSWTRKKHDLSLTVDVQEYDLSSVISDFNPLWGIYEVYIGGVLIDFVEYTERSNYSESERWYFKPDGKTIGFTQDIDGTEDIDVWYYAQITSSANDEDATLNIPIAEDASDAICLWAKYLVHEGKRQRFDSRNALLDFKDAMDNLRPQEASNKARNVPKTVPTPMRHSGFSRNYGHFAE